MEYRAMEGIFSARMVKKRRQFMGLRPAMRQSASSGKKGSRMAQANSRSNLVPSSSQPRYLSQVASDSR